MSSRGFGLLKRPDEAVVVKDLLLFRQPFLTRVRQQWQTRDISPKAGPHWVNVNIPFLLNTGLGQGRGVCRWMNPAWDLLIYFTPQPGRDYEVYDRALENIWQAVPLRVSQRFRGLPEKQTPLHFTTLLWPHKPVLEAQQYAARIEVLADNPLLTALKVAISDEHTLLLGINDTGRAQEVGPVRTDASVFVLSCTKDQGARQPAYLFAGQATEFRLDGRVLHQAKEKTDVDRSL